jgi:hypothetical protein
MCFGNRSMSKQVDSHLSLAAPTFQPSQQVGHVSDKLLDFCLKDPESWFTQEDSDFCNTNITHSLTKYPHTSWCSGSGPLTWMTHTNSCRLSLQPVSERTPESRLLSCWTIQAWAIATIDPYVPHAGPPARRCDTHIGFSHPGCLLADMRDQLAAQDLLNQRP